MRIFVILNLLVLIFSCSNAEKIDDGLWLCVSSNNELGGEIDNFRLALSISNDTFSFINFGCKSTHQIKIIEKGKIYENNSFKINNEIYVINRIEGDSIITLKRDVTHEATINEHKFKRLKKSLKFQKDRLIGNVFQLNYPSGIIDTLDFINDSLILQIGSNVSNFRVIKWRKETFADTDFLLFESNGAMCWIPFLLNRNLEIVTHNPKSNFTESRIPLQELSTEFDKDLYYGKWILEKDTLNKLSQSKDNEDRELLVCKSESIILEINQEKIQLNTCGTVLNWDYKFNNSNMLLYPKSDVVQMKNKILKTKELTNDKLILSTCANLKRSYNIDENTDLVFNKKP